MPSTSTRESSLPVYCCPLYLMYSHTHIHTHTVSAWLSCGELLASLWNFYVGSINWDLHACMVKCVATAFIKKTLACYTAFCLFNPNQPVIPWILTLGIVKARGRGAVANLGDGIGSYEEGCTLLLLQQIALSLVAHGCLFLWPWKCFFSRKTLDKRNAKCVSWCKRHTTQI